MLWNEDSKVLWHSDPMVADSRGKSDANYLLKNEAKKKVLYSYKCTGLVLPKMFMSRAT